MSDDWDAAPAWYVWGYWRNPTPQLEERDAKIEELMRALAESQANDRQAMAYLNEVRAIVGGDDFPDMIKRAAKLREDAERYQRLRQPGYAGVTVWVGDMKCTTVVTETVLGEARCDVLVECFKKARHAIDDAMSKEGNQ